MGGAFRRPPATRAALYTSVNTQRVTTPSTAALQVTGDMEIIFRAAADDYTPSVAQFPMAKRSSSLQFQLGFTGSSGTLSFSARIAGVDRFGVAQAANPGWVDGTTYWFRVRRTASSGVVTMAYAADQADIPTNWTALTVTGEQQAGDIDGNSDALSVAGMEAGPQPFVGKLYRAILRDGIGGTVVADYDSTLPVTNYRDVTGRVWTVVGTPSWSLAE
jgi:hypothetical protein